MPSFPFCVPFGCHRWRACSSTFLRPLTSPPSSSLQQPAGQLSFAELLRTCTLPGRELSKPTVRVEQDPIVWDTQSRSTDVIAYIFDGGWVFLHLELISLLSTCLAVHPLFLTTNTHTLKNRWREQAPMTRREPGLHRSQISYVPETGVNMAAALKRQVRSCWIGVLLCGLCRVCPLPPLTGIDNSRLFFF